MSPPIPVLASVATPALFSTLGWAFLTSALVWLLIWRLLRPGSTESVESPTSRPPFDKPETEIIPAPAPALAAAAPKTTPAAGRVINISRAPKTETPFPSPTEAPNDEPPAAPPSSDPEPTPAAAPEPDHGAETSSESQNTETTSPPGIALDPAPESPLPAEPPSTEELPAIRTATLEEAAAAFRTELAAGIVRQDDRYGIVYLAPANDPDDLKKIKGIAKKLEKKLNHIGVWQYRQIAVWTAPAVEEFSKLLPNFKDRILRDDWIAQAKLLHEETYGESL